MFHRTKWLKKGGRLRAPWEAAWNCNMDTDLDSVSLPQLCDDLCEVIKSDSKNLNHRISLRSSANLMYGICVLHKMKVNMCDDILKNSNSTIGSTMSSESESHSQHSTNDESHDSPDNDNQGTEISLNAIETVLNERNISEEIDSVSSQNVIINDYTRKGNFSFAKSKRKITLDFQSRFENKLLIESVHSSYEIPEQSFDVQQNTNNSVSTNSVDSKEQSPIYDRIEDIPFVNPEQLFNDDQNLNFSICSDSVHSKEKSSIYKRSEYSMLDISGEPSNVQEYSNNSNGLNSGKKSFIDQENNTSENSLHETIEQISLDRQNSNNPICSSSMNLENNLSSHSTFDYNSSQSSNPEWNNNELLHSTLNINISNDECHKRNTIYLYHPKKSCCFDPEKLIVSRTKYLNNAKPKRNDFAKYFKPPSYKINDDEVQNTHDIVVLKVLSDYWKKNEVISLQKLLAHFPKSWISIVILSVYNLKNHRYVILVKERNIVVAIVSGPAFGRLKMCMYSQTI